MEEQETKQEQQQEPKQEQPSGESVELGMKGFVCLLASILMCIVFAIFVAKALDRSDVAPSQILEERNEHMILEDGGL